MLACWPDAEGCAAFTSHASSWAVEKVKCGLTLPQSSSRSIPKYGGRLLTKAKGPFTDSTSLGAKQRILLLPCVSHLNSLGYTADITNSTWDISCFPTSYINSFLSPIQRSLQHRCLGQASQYIPPTSLPLIPTILKTPVSLRTHAAQISP